MKKQTLLMIAFLTAVVVCRPVAAAHAQNIKEDYEKLKREYEKVVIDRDNLLIQSKNLLGYKSKAQLMEQESAKGTAEVAQAKKLLGEIQEENKRIRDDYESQLDSLKRAQEEEKFSLTEEARDLRERSERVSKERDELKNLVEKLQIEYKIIPETRREVVRLQNDKKELLKEQSRLKEQIRKLEEERLDAYAQTEIFRTQLNESKKNYEEALAKNRQLERKTEEVPAKFAELARENKVLIKETALMHYNLGVFYTKNKEYERAIAEFEKSIELNPDDAYSHFNLGYIYAEYLVNRPKAVSHFRKFLSQVKTEDKDVDWVKKYIITWQTWEGKKTIK